MQVAIKNVIAIALVLMATISTLALRSPYEGCASYTQALNGGMRAFGGEKYKVELCGTRRFLGDGDEIRFRVLGPAGDVLAERFFAVRTMNDAAPRESLINSGRREVVGDAGAEFPDAEVKSGPFGEVRPEDALHFSHLSHT